MSARRVGVRRIHVCYGSRAGLSFSEITQFRAQNRRAASAAASRVSGNWARQVPARAQTPAGPLSLEPRRIPRSPRIGHRLPRAPQPGSPGATTPAGLASLESLLPRMPARSPRPSATFHGPDLVQRNPPSPKSRIGGRGKAVAASRAISVDQARPARPRLRPGAARIAATERVGGERRGRPMEIVGCHVRYAPGKRAASRRLPRDP